ncbi:tellurite resistance TerB family protein [Winogradskyella aurantia]|uniref:Co-chaperone DjlA N-terminal domain-containing protein n=1 Tax=Winogradskyella aurantia TaxID=1915063 RepID=A0A265UWN3_9FLAO|nr:TerB family tellurite resistance protein [Winogradskyella aurantia]OZV69706.1 hypothetical protein CA834_03530 [Winogradskyella aurantia]
MTVALLQHISYLFYAIAKADNTLSMDEYRSLTEILKRHWTSLDEEQIEVITTQFNALQKANRSPESCFDAFIAYVHQHPEEFTKALRTLLLRSANKIAYAFAKMSKNELHYIAKLSLEFKKINT